PLVLGELEGMAGRPAIVVGRPALDRRPRAVDPLGEEPAGPVEVIAIGARSDQVEGHAILGQPFGEPPILTAIILGGKLAATSPALVADAPVADAERFAAAVGRSLVGQGGGPGRGVGILDPLLEFLGRTGPDVAREVRLDAAKLAEAEELVGPELIGLGLLAPSPEAARPLRRRADAVAPVVLVSEAAARPSDDDRAELADVFDEGPAEAVDVG